jgi:tRNA (adenine57-N1/adenine58-N1)-methyltransferase catalytic subunit
MKPIKKLLLTNQGNAYYVKDTDQDYHTQYGYIRKNDLAKKNGTKLKTNTGKEMMLLLPQFMDSYKRIKRSAQIIPLKDIGAIITETGINSKSRIVDAGAGSGALSCLLAHLAKEVITYEIRDDFAGIVEENIEFLGLKNIKLKRKSIYDGIDEKNVDMITLDLPEPWNAISSAEKALKIGGFLVSYSPTIPQVMDFTANIQGNANFLYLKTIEIIEREWDIEGRKVRPKSQAIGHSGFLTFCRRI